MDNTFNTGDIIQHKDYKEYYYIVIDTFHRYTIEYYNLYCFIGSKEVSLRMDNTKNFKIASKA